MAYQANRNHNNENQSDSRAQSWLEKKQEQKAQNRENTKELAKDAGTVALQGLGVPGPLAGMAANKIAQNPLVNKTLNKVSDKLHKNPVASKAINTVAQSPAKDAAMGALGGKVGGTTGASGAASKGDAASQAGKSAETSGNSLGMGKQSFGKSSPFAKKSNLDSDKGEEQGQAKTTMGGIGNMVATIKKVPPWLWPVIGWAALIFMGIIVILGLISQFVPMFGVDNSFGQGGDSGIEYVANSEEEQAFYDRIAKVKKEYTDKGATYESGYISGTFFIMNRHDKEFTFEDMTESEIRKISELMFQDSAVVITCEKEGADSQTVEGVKGSEPSCPEGYTKNPDKTTVTYIYDEATFKEGLANYMKDKLTLDDNDEAKAIAEEVFDYIDKYKSFVSTNKSEGVIGNKNGSYWWPIGSSQTTSVGGHLFATGDPATVLITSYFGARQDPITGEWQKAHGAIDIAGVEANVGNVIAAKDGIVENVSTGCLSYGDTNCGGGYGNYIILKHTDGNYTLYAHLHQNSITVSMGDSVRQGQVIGKVGSSGYSTGAHLHFEIRVGQNTSSSKQDPLLFVDPNNPRPTTIVSSEFVTMLHSWEGTGPTEGDNYIVYPDSGGVLTVGHGVTIAYNLSKFESFNIDESQLKEGDRVAKSIVDAVEAQIINDKYNSVVSLLSMNSITLKDYQIEALISRMYNVGNVNEFPANYRLYGNTQSLYDNYMSKPITDVKGNVLEGLISRREAEWNLFHTGVYTNNS